MGAALYLRPKTLNDAVLMLAEAGGQILSGGTDFYPALGERLPQGRIVDISRVREIRGISIEQDYVRIGGATTWSEVVRTPLPRCFDALKAAAREIGSVQIQNRGTVAGNLCNASPAADGVPPLLALDAEVELVSSARDIGSGGRAAEGRKCCVGVFEAGCASVSGDFDFDGCGCRADGWIGQNTGRTRGGWFLFCYSPAASPTGA